jgi:hypothetical protein
MDIKLVHPNGYIEMMEMKKLLALKLDSIPRCRKEVSGMVEGET